jgi:phosphatidylserine decarboxylase
MYHFLFRRFPKRAFSRLMGRLADAAWPGWLLRPVIALYVAAFRIDLGVFVVPEAGFPTFNAFFTRAVRPEARPVDPAPGALVSPVDGTVVACGAIERGRLLQAKGHDYSLAALLGEAPGWESYEGGTALTVYLSPRDYHRIHSPCAGAVRRFAYVPGDLWTVSPLGVSSVPGLFARNERIVTWIAAAWGEVALVAVGATVVGGVQVVYHPQTTNRPGARPFHAALESPYLLERGAELGRFRLGSTVILLVRPGEASLLPLAPGALVRMGQAVGSIAAAGRIRPAHGADAPFTL